MFLSDKYDSQLSPFRKSQRRLPPLPSKPFDEALIARLKSLLPIPNPPPSIPLAWLTLAVDVLSGTISDAGALVSDPSLSASDRSALASHLDFGVSLLDACNAISAHIDRHLRARLLIRLALHLISSSPENVRRSRELIREWEESRISVVPIKTLRPSDPPRGKVSAVHRAIYAVESVSSLVVGAVLAAIGGGEKVDLAGIQAPSEFPWAEAFNKVVAEVSGKLPGSAGELEVVEARVRELVAVIGGDDGEMKDDTLRSAVEEAEKATEELTEGLECLSDAVSGLFRAAMSTRNTALQSFQIGPQKCK